MIHVTDQLILGDKDVVYRCSRSGGPGGQNVNKLNTRVTLLFDVGRCDKLTDEQKTRLLGRLSNRISKNGSLTVVSQRYRTQQANRRAAGQRLAELLAAALARTPMRKETTIPWPAGQERLRRKRRRSELKRQRKSVALDGADD